MKTLDAIKKLNAVKKGDDTLLKTLIDINGLKNAKEKDLAEAFMTAIETIPESDDKFIPKELGNLYNKLADAEKEAAEKEAADKESKAPAKKAPAKKAPAKEEAKKAPAKKAAPAKEEAKKAPAKKAAPAKEEAKKAPAKKAPAKEESKKVKKDKKPHKKEYAKGMAKQIYELILQSPKGITLQKAVEKAAELGAKEGYVKHIFQESVSWGIAKEESNKYFPIVK
jgi:hypothetical protein